MITLYKGDDTGGQLGKNVKIVFHCDDAVDMDDVVVKFDLLGIVKREFTDVHDGDVLDIFISHAESRKFPLGVIFAKMWGEDASGKLRTFANRIPFRVTLNLIAVYGSDGTDSQDIHVYSSVDWDSIANKPTVFPSSVEDVEGLQEELDDINGKIPEDASSDNQLADKEWVDQEIDRVAAYYITSDAQGSNFPTHAALINAQTYYSGGAPRVPTRNDYAVVLADETHEGSEYRYIFAKPEGSTVGQWEAQYPIESVITFDDSVTRTSQNAVRSSGIWSMIWGALASLPTGFTSLYDWCVIQLAGKVPTSRTVNNKSLDADVDLTSDDIPYTEYETVSEKLGSIDYDIGTHIQNTTIHVTAAEKSTWNGKQNALTAQQLANIAAVPSKANRAANPTAGNLAALDANGNPTDSGVKPSDKLDSTSAAPAFSSDSTVQYAVGAHVTYNGKLYRCTTSTTGGTWVAGSWTAEDMTTPDATLDVTAPDKLLRLVATNGDVIWGQGYNLSTTSSATVLTEQVRAFTFAADAVADQAIVLPTVAAGKVGDFILDVTNLSANDRSLTLTGLDSAFSVVVKAGDDLSETLTVAAGEMARYYFTMTAFRVNSLPTWQVAKEAVEDGGAQS